MSAEGDVKPTTAFAHLFKSHGEDSQTRRRKLQLEMQRQRREKAIERKRYEDEDEDEVDDETSSSSSSSMVAEEASTIAEEVKVEEGMKMQDQGEKRKRRRGGKRRGYGGPRKEDVKEQLIIPENLLEVPEDLKQSWLVVPIPSDAERCLVVSSGSQTIKFSNAGDQLLRFSSLLPNGSSNSRGGDCFLDCFFHAQTQTFFVLDMLSWKGNSYTDCDTSFRWFFLQQKLSELRRIQVRSDSNHFVFQQAPYFDCTLAGLQAATMSPLLPFVADHLLLYHKDVHYTPGPSPLVCSVPVSSAAAILSPVL